MINLQKPTEVVVIGAGYAGLLATVRLAGKLRRARAAGAPAVQITLVNAADAFVERIRLHEFAANQPLKHRPLTAILRGTGVRFVEGYAHAIDTRQRVVSVATPTGPRSLTYDKLLYAAGSIVDRDSVPGVREHAYTLSADGPRSAPALRSRLAEVAACGGRLVVCGAGATGIEAAAEFAAAYPRLHVALVTRGPFGAFRAGPVAAYMRRSLERLGVAIREGTTVIAVGPSEIVTDGSAIPYDVCLWTGGFVAPPLAREAGLAVNERGQILVDPFMRALSDPAVFAVGDAAWPVEEPGVRVRMSAFTALILGAHGADCLAAVLQGQTPRPLSFAYMGQGIALGRHNAIGYHSSADDVPLPPYFTGRAGYAIRRLGTTFLAGVFGIERRWPGFYFWLGKGRYAAAKRAGHRQAPLDAAS